MVPTLRDRLAALGASPTRPLMLGPSCLELLGSSSLATSRSATSERAGGEGAHGAIAHAIRRAGHEVIAHQRRVVEAGADLIVAPTAATTAIALHASGQAYRAAALTAAAVDLTRDAVLAASARASVLGEVLLQAGARAHAEARVHLDRLATSAVDGLLFDCADAPTRDGALGELLAASAALGLAALVEIDANEVDRIDGALVAAPHVALLLRGGDPALLATAIARVREAHPRVILGARVVVSHRDDADAQLAAAAAWDTLAALGLAVVGVRGDGALAALRALGDLAGRPSLAPPPPSLPTASSKTDKRGS